MKNTLPAIYIYPIRKRDSACCMKLLFLTAPLTYARVLQRSASAVLLISTRRQQLSVDTQQINHSSIANCKRFHSRGNGERRDVVAGRAWSFSLGLSVRLRDPTSKIPTQLSARQDGTCNFQPPENAFGDEDITSPQATDTCRSSEDGGVSSP